MSLFEHGPFTLPSGNVTQFKIECDDLTKQDWDALARIAAYILGPFYQVEGVPRGGIPFADAIRPYNSSEGPLLIVDDVWVTGKSMEAHRAGRPAIGIVAFARNPTPLWVDVLFRMNPNAEKATYLDL